MEPRTSVYKNRGTGTYYVQTYTIGPVAATWCGNPEVIGPEDFPSKISEAVIKSLNNFARQKYDPAKAIRFNAKEQEEFLKSHIEVSIGRSSSGGVVIHALRPERGGRVGVEGDAITLSEEELPHKLAEAIAEAFRKAT